MAANVLEQLGKRGRMLGIITYVSALFERFPNRIRVHKLRTRVL